MHPSTRVLLFILIFAATVILGIVHIFTLIPAFIYNGTCHYFKWADKFSEKLIG